LRARSTAAAVALPSAGTCDRLARDGLPEPADADAAGVGIGGVAGPFVIVISSPLLRLSVVRSGPSAFADRRSARRSIKKPPPSPARVPSVSVVGLCSPIPPRSSVLPPGAANEAEKAKRQRAKKSEERYVDEAGVVHGHGHASTVRRDHDRNGAPILSVEEAQSGLRSPHPALSCAAMSAQSSSIRQPDATVVSLVRESVSAN